MRSLVIDTLVFFFIFDDTDSRISIFPKKLSIIYKLFIMIDRLFIMIDKLFITLDNPVISDSASKNHLVSTYGKNKILFWLTSVIYEINFIF